MKPADIPKARNPDLRASMTALRRAAVLARKIAIETDTELVVVQEGKLVRIPAETLRNEAKAQRDSAP